MNLAPNGKPSNLTHEQYKLVRTPEFKAWFGDWENDSANASKVVDKNGEPLVVLHGSTGFHDGKNSDIKGEITQFSSGRLIFTTANIDVSKYFGYYKYYFINLKKPIIVKDYHQWNRLSEIELIDIDSFGYYVKENYSYDGIIAYDIEETTSYIRAEDYIAFEPTQLKLADGTNTTFDN